MDNISSAKHIAETTIAKYRPTKVYGCFSGGHDSLVALHACREFIDAAVHINTGIGIEETREFVRTFCKDQNIPLVERLPPSKTYEELIIEYGFPGPAAHSIMYRYLKERALREIFRESRSSSSDHVIFITGVRQQESSARMGYVSPIRIDPSYNTWIWCAPLHDWSKRDINNYIEDAELERNIVVDSLHMSGECLCGSYARKTEFRDIEFWFPDTAQHIKSLETLVENSIHDPEHKRWGWKDRVHDAQLDFLPLCRSCVNHK